MCGFPEKVPELQEGDAEREEESVWNLAVVKEQVGQAQSVSSPGSPGSGF